MRLTSALPWALFQNLPLINIARTPARFNFAVGFAMAVLVGYGVSVLLSMGRKLAEREAVNVIPNRRSETVGQALRSSRAVALADRDASDGRNRV